MACCISDTSWPLLGFFYLYKIVFSQMTKIISKFTQILLCRTMGVRKKYSFRMTNIWKKYFRTVERNTDFVLKGQKHVCQEVFGRWSSICQLPGVRKCLHRFAASLVLFAADSRRRSLHPLVFGLASMRRGKQKLWPSNSTRSWAPPAAGSPPRTKTTWREGIATRMRTTI